MSFEWDGGPRNLCNYPLCYRLMNLGLNLTPHVAKVI